MALVDDRRGDEELTRLQRELVEGEVDVAGARVDGKGRLAVTRVGPGDLHTALGREAEPEGHRGQCLGRLVADPDGAGLSGGEEGAGPPVLAEIVDLGHADLAGAATGCLALALLGPRLFPVGARIRLAAVDGR